MAQCTKGAGLRVAQKRVVRAHRDAINRWASVKPTFIWCCSVKRFTSHSVENRRDSFALKILLQRKQNKETSSSHSKCIKDMKHRNFIAIPYFSGRFALLDTIIENVLHIIKRMRCREGKIKIYSRRQQRYGSRWHCLSNYSCNICRCSIESFFIFE